MIHCAFSLKTAALSIHTLIGVLEMELLFFAGDIFDRGNKVTELLWLIYKLQTKRKIVMVLCSGF